MGIICMLLFSFFNTLPAIVIKYLIDPLQTEGTEKIEVISFFWVGVGIIALFIFKGLAYFGQNYLMNTLGQQLIHDLRNRLFHKLIYLPLSYFHKMTSGRLINRFTTDLNIIEQAVFISITGPLRDFPQVIILLCVMVYRSWQLFLIMMIALPIAAFLIGRFSRMNKTIASHRMMKYDDLTNTLTEVINGIRIIKSFNMEEKEVQKFNDINARKLNGIGLKLSEASIAAYRVFKLDDERNLIIENRKSTPLPLFEKQIEINISNFAYEDTTVLKNISLTIPFNQTVGLVGSTGSGKSTLVNLIPRFYDLKAQEGSIKIDGYDIRDVDVFSLRRQIAVVTQETILFNDTIRNNITCGLEVGTEKVEQAAVHAYAQEFIERLPDGYDQYVGEKGYSLSGGEKQRISIARALIKDAPILILDEATSHLDNKSELKVQQAIDNLLSKRTTIIIAHRLSTIKKADIIYFMKDGEIVESGTHQELVSSDSQYRKYYEIQFES
ncbi:hypothetical protein CHS0354_018465 [Potamilus streckersoni]|uniref:ABC transporter ATP-binding protein n=1 Tax=Potamilus streckersoni TaxID=2493646 RepID=A0AAE0W9Y7_9BIVA|nr:hypothetical protein CHS0354_018465 [Potamilus streckersoni]